MRVRTSYDLKACCEVRRRGYRAPSPKPLSRGESGLVPAHAVPVWLHPMQSENIHNAATRLVVVSGMSGSGKTIALRTLEDLDYYCVDNLPSALMQAFVAAVTQAQPGLHLRLAVGIDVRNRAEDLNRLPEILADLARRGIEHRLIFLDARDDVLFKRYSDTRRRQSIRGWPLFSPQPSALSPDLKTQTAPLGRSA